MFSKLSVSEKSPNRLFRRAQLNIVKRETTLEIFGSVEILSELQVQSVV